jgi:hypothetical protein
MPLVDDVTEPEEPAPTDLVSAALELVELMTAEEHAELVACQSSPPRLRRAGVRSSRRRRPRRPRCN